MQATDNLITSEEDVSKNLRNHAVVCHQAYSAFRIVQSHISQNVAFNRLPMELNEQIAYNLSNDKDLSSFSAVCRSTRDAVFSDRSGVWRSRFSTAFDFPAGKSSTQMKHDYRLRRKYLRRPCPFGEIRQTDENQCLTIIRDMVIESFSETNLRSKNQTLLCIMLKDSSILRKVLHWSCGEPSPEQMSRVNPMLYTIQLVFTSWAFKIQICDRKVTPSFIYTYPDAQSAAFGHPIYDPLITAYGIVNVQRALDISNYFKYHCTQEASNILVESFFQSPEDHLPRVWDQKLSDSSLRLGRRWRGLMGALAT
ncbi:MAG: hypothetical protein Q9167_000685 [Letrouitia subvulpina]